MKKYIILSASLLAVFCACTKNETTPVILDENTPVAFQAMGYSAQTKADNPTFTNDDFGIFGYQHSLEWADANAENAAAGDKPSLLMNDIQVLHSPATEGYGNINGGDFWAPVQVYYWPKNDYLSFAAYSPYGMGGASYSYAKGIAFAEFTVDPAPGEGNEIDLLYSDVASNKNLGNYTEGPHETNPDGVYILFHHALAQVSISAQFSGKKNPGTTVVINVTDITVNGIDTKGTGFNATDKVWTSSTPATQDLEITPADLGASEATGFISGYYVMPQALTEGTQQILISYTITTTFGDGTTKSETISGKPVDLKGGSIDEWAPNKKYSYNLLISAVSDDPITFDPAVEAWTD